MLTWWLPGCNIIHHGSEEWTANYRMVKFAGKTVGQWDRRIKMCSFFRFNQIYTLAKP